MIRLTAIDSSNSELVDCVYEHLNYHPNDALSRMARPRGRSRSQIQELLLKREASDDFYYSVELISHGSSQHVGLIQGIWIDRISLTVDVGIAIFNQHHGHGYGTAALKLFLCTICEYYNVRKATASILASNKISRKLFERTGFSACGTYSKHFLVNRDYHDVVLYEMFLDSFRA